jgi:predicted SAM-dependent methyltransferase
VNVSTAKDWDWHDPEALAAKTDAFMVERAVREKLEPIAAAAPFSRGQLAELGLDGIEFAAFTTAHPSGLASDFLSLRTADATTAPGRIFRVDGDGYFLEHDIADPLPLADACVDWVYAEHLIEHVSLTVGIRWLTEVRRILAPGGVLRLTTPDLHTYIESYLRGDPFFAKHRGRMRTALSGVAPPMPNRPAFMVNQLFYLYGHRWIYDLEEVRYALEQAGFDAADMRVRAYRQGSRPDVADLDTAIRNDETMYVEITA